MKNMQRYISLFFVAVLAIGSFSCKKDPEVNTERIRIHENEKQFSTDGETVSMNLSGSVSYSKAITKMTLWLGSIQDLSDAVSYDVNLQDTTFSVDVDNLKSDSTYYYRFGIYRYSEEFDKEMEIWGMQTNEVSTHNLCFVPKIETGEVSHISQTSAVVAGMVVNDGGASVIERGICWSLENIPTIADNRISSETNETSFSVTISGLMSETTYYVRAYAINEVGVGYGNIETINTLSAELGILCGKFSIGGSSQVRFSQGNLQYQASTKTWRFANHQYDVICDANSNISSSYNGWIDLFGWGTSGYNHGAVCYQPWSVSTGEYDYEAYGSNVAELWFHSGNADWGYNAISNGGNKEAQWHTLSSGEWEYIFNKRNTASGIRYARGKVNGINGILLFPDDWEESLYPIVHFNYSFGSLSHFNDNTIPLSDWEQLEFYGVVFLPLAGFRWGTDVDLSKGMYWSSSNFAYGTMAYCINFDDSQLDPSNSNTGLEISSKGKGLSVRLVRNIE